MWKKSSFTELLKGIEFLEIISHDLLEIKRRQFSGGSDQNGFQSIFPQLVSVQKFKSKSLSGNGFTSIGVAPEGL